MNRQFIEDSITINDVIELSDQQHHHISKVLKKKIGDSIILFNNTGKSFYTEIVDIRKKHTSVRVVHEICKDVESPLNLHLAQIISRKSAMDLSIEKATELGITSITPILGQFTAKYRSNQMSAWKKTIIQACMQCGRNKLPDINSPIAFNELLSNTNDETTIYLDPHGASQLDCTSINTNKITLIIGPEEGFSDAELDALKNSKAVAWNLGPRVLRTETASITAISIIQYLFGDLNNSTI